MADRRGSAQGGTGQLPALDLSMLEEVPQVEELSLSRTGPSRYKPYVDMARRSPNKKFRENVPVMENGEAKTDESGNIVKAPREYTAEEAVTFRTELRSAAAKDKLAAHRESLRVVADPTFAAIERDKIKSGIKIQFYVVKRTPAEPQS